MGISYENIDNLKRKYNLLIIHGNIEASTFLKKCVYSKYYVIYKSICFRIT